MSSMGGAVDMPATFHSTMGATDVLPYPRRRSSVQLEPLDCRLASPAESQDSPTSKSRTTSTGTEEDLLPGAVVDASSSHPALNPVKVQGHRKLVSSNSEDMRCNSCENPRRGRSQSLRPERVRPGEARRRLPSDGVVDDDDEETTAEFIEKLRKELISQLNHV